MFEGTLSNNNIHLELHISGENRTRLRCDGVKRRARIAAHGRYFLTKRTIGTADGRQWPAFREIFAQEFKTSSTSKETSIFEIPIRRGEDNSSTDFTKIFNILEGKLTGENRTRLRCDGVKRRARIAAHGRYFLTKRTIGTADGRQWPAFREIFAQEFKTSSTSKETSIFEIPIRRGEDNSSTDFTKIFNILEGKLTGENRTRLRCDGVKRRARIAAHGRYFLTKRTIGTADGRQWPAFREIFAQEFKTSSTSKETSIFEIPIRRGEDNSSTDFTKIFNILEGKLTGENRTRLRCDGVKRRARIAAHGRYFLTKRTIGTADGRQWPAFREIFAQEFKTSSTSKETSIFEIPIRRGEDNSSTDFTKIFNILEGKLTGENRTRLRCDGVKRRARIAAHGRYFLTKRTIGTADGRQWPAFREIFAQEFKTSSTSKETSIFEIPIRRGEDNSSTDFTKIFNILEGKLTGENRTRLRCDGVKRRARIAAHGRYFSLNERSVQLTAGSGRRSEKSSLRCENNGDMRRPASGAAAG
ncbi:hypothetical protein EVAR_3182_1 [Eumeta japonica]|uniref:Uncharacterized protein n=1 Tax=Eumeta variegata TaxID=151549 RepID=A0A4C1XHA8_EUMVA|nr:hypothetical protein EVAR_3182_1 [Eumeta japonica]